jgi:hypothetical protein
VTSLLGGRIRSGPGPADQYGPVRSRTLGFGRISGRIPVPGHRVVPLSLLRCGNRDKADW